MGFSYEYNYICMYIIYIFVVYTFIKCMKFMIDSWQQKRILIARTRSTYRVQNHILNSCGYYHASIEIVWGVDN